MIKYGSTFSPNFISSNSLYNKCTLGDLTIRGLAPDSEGARGGVILKGLEGFRGGTKRVTLYKGGVRKFDQF